MQRDPELIRQLMLRLESFPMGRGAVLMLDPCEDLLVEGYSHDQIDYHMRQILMSGWVDMAGGLGISISGKFSFRALTPAGHDFVDSVRDEAIWRLTKNGVTEAGGFTLETLSALGKAFLKNRSRSSRA
ncbi:DUF2513 domain-containing protein [Azorhizophilus paspali]|uniref:DUF2513 domain-containing protein n=1 Tax=Azorhizophilus paspali TaxID=69963 RepID=UPI00362CF4A7